MLGHVPSNCDWCVSYLEELVVEAAGRACQHELQYLGRLVDQRAQRDYLLKLDLSWGALFVTYLDVVECLEQAICRRLIVLGPVVR